MIVVVALVVVVETIISDEKKNWFLALPIGQATGFLVKPKD